MSTSIATGTSIASRLITSTLTLLSKLSSATRKPNDTTKPSSDAEEVPRPPLENEFWRFRLWARGFDIPGGHFDDVLEQEIHLKEPTITLLASFAAILAGESRESKFNEPLSSLSKADVRINKKSRKRMAVTR